MNAFKINQVQEPHTQSTDIIFFRGLWATHIPFKNHKRNRKRVRGDEFQSMYIILNNIKSGKQKIAG